MSPEKWFAVLVDSWRLGGRLDLSARHRAWVDEVYRAEMVALVENKEMGLGSVLAGEGRTVYPERVGREGA
jgi:hypothetical protein